MAPEAWTNIDASWNALLSKLPAPMEGIMRRLLAGVVGETALSHWPPNILVHDVTRGLPFAANTAGVVYASHLIEHLDKAAAREFVRECFRVLMPGGVIRLVTPDLAYLASTYLARKPESMTAADEFIESLGLIHPSPRKLFLKWYRGKHEFHSHKWLYDADSLRSLLASCGFASIEREEFLNSRIPEARLREVELSYRFERSVCLEAQK